MEEKTSNYAKHAQAARELFLKWDRDAMIARFGLEHDDGFLYIPFFGQKHGVNRLTGEVLLCDGGIPAGFNAVMSIYDILCYTKDEARLSGEWSTLQNLSPHSNFGSKGGDMFGPAAKRLSGRAPELRIRCEKLGGREATKADVGYIFDAFSFLPALFQFWEGDEEFEPKIHILFDKNTLDYIHFETAWYVAGHLIDLISA